MVQAWNSKRNSKTEETSQKLANELQNNYPLQRRCEERRIIAQKVLFNKRLNDLMDKKERAKV